jgi:cysteine synthase A
MTIQSQERSMSSIESKGFANHSRSNLGLANATETAFSANSVKSVAKSVQFNSFFSKVSMQYWEKELNRRKNEFFCGKVLTPEQISVYNFSNSKSSETPRSSSDTTGRQVPDEVEMKQSEIGTQGINLFWRKEKKDSVVCRRSLLRIDGVRSRRSPRSAPEGAAFLRKNASSLNIARKVIHATRINPNRENRGSRSRRMLDLGTECAASKSARSETDRSFYATTEVSMRRSESVWESVGNTPLIRIRSLSEMTGCEIYGKAEFLNPGGSIKDRAAKGIIERAEREGALKPGGTIVEGTAGNTGIGLATLAAERGYRVVISMPDNQAREKYQMLEALGAEVRAVKPCPFSSSDHFYHRAKQIAAEIDGAVWADQFENTANAEMHYLSTGPELWSQTEGRIDLLVAASGTGGTMGGVSSFLKERTANVTIIAADPEGSGIHDYVKTGSFDGDGSSITEGIGIKRLTANLARARIDDAIRVSDRQMIDMLFHAARRDGLFLGTSSALNLYGAFAMGLRFKGSGKRIVTFLCDHGSRYASKILDPSWMEEKGLTPKALEPR